MMTETSMIESSDITQRVAKNLEQFEYICDRARIFIADYFFDCRNDIDLNTERILLNLLPRNNIYIYFRPNRSQLLDSEYDRFKEVYDGGFACLAYDGEEKDIDRSLLCELRDENISRCNIYNIDMDSAIHRTIKEWKQASTTLYKCDSQMEVNRINCVREKMISFLADREKKCLERFELNGLDLIEPLRFRAAGIRIRIRQQTKAAEELSLLLEETEQLLDLLKFTLLNSTCYLFVPNTTKNPRFNLSQLISINEYFSESLALKVVRFLNTDIVEVDEAYHDDSSSFYEVLYKFFKNEFRNLLDKKILSIEKIFRNYRPNQNAINELSTCLPIANVFGMNNCFSINLSKSSLFENFVSLKYLRLNNNSIRTITPFMFNHLLNLHSLDLDSNKIDEINENAFFGLQNLQILLLGHNEISKISERTFIGLNNLLVLFLDQNKIQQINENAFVPCSQLESLHLEHNQLCEIRFLDCLALNYLDLGHNNISELGEDCFIGLNKLIDLRLAHNRIHCLKMNTFRGLDLLEGIDLEFNDLKIDSIDRQTFRHLKNLQRLWLGENNIGAFVPKLFGVDNVANISFI